MKTRRGFVSNSSTTSFCIFGIAIDEENDLWSEARKVGLEQDYYSEFCDGPRQVIGLSYSKIGDDETGAQFKRRVIDLVKSIHPEADESAFGHHEDAYRDG
jgi:hypothetical protein